MNRGIEMFTVCIDLRSRLLVFWEVLLEFDEILNTSLLVYDSVQFYTN